MFEGDIILRRNLLKELSLPFGVDNITNELPGELCAIIAYRELFSTEVRNYDETIEEEVKLYRVSVGVI